MKSQEKQLAEFAKLVDLGKGHQPFVPTIESTPKPVSKEDAMKLAELRSTYDKKQRFSVALALETM